MENLTKGFIIIITNKENKNIIFKDATERHQETFEGFYPFYIMQRVDTNGISSEPGE